MMHDPAGEFVSVLRMCAALSGESREFPVGGGTLGMFQCHTCTSFGLPFFGNKSSFLVS